jgi:hypothetical protein
MEEKSFLYSKRQWWGYLHFGDKNISIQLFWLAACREVTNPCKISQLNFCGCRWDHIHARLPNTSQFHGGKIPLSRTKSTKQSLIWSFHKWLQLYTFLFCFHFGSPQLGYKLDYWSRESTSRGVKWLSLALLSTVPSFGTVLIQSKLQIQLLLLSRAVVCEQLVAPALALLLPKLHHWNS